MKNVASWIDLALDEFRICTYLFTVYFKFLYDLIFYHAFTFSVQQNLYPISDYLFNYK